MRRRAVPLATAIAALLSVAAANAQTGAPADAAAPVADTGPKGEAELAATRKTVQDLEAQVIELRRIIEAMDRSRASVDDIRRRLDELDARLGENDRRDEALATGAGREATLFKFRDDGFAMRSPHGRFLLVPHLRLQTVYEGVVAAEGTADAARPDRSGFALAHAEVILDGHVGSRVFAYRLQLDAAESPSINDAYVQVGLMRNLGVRVGQFKVPYGYQRWTYSGELEFVTISAPMAAFALDRDVGLMATGHPFAGRLTYEAAVINGAGAGLPNDNIDLAYAARIVAAPFGPLTPGEGDLEWHTQPRASLGLAGYYNLVPTDVRARTGDPTTNLDQDNDGRIDNVAVWQGNVELRALWRGAALQAEWFGRTEIPGGIYSSRRTWGGYVQASYFVIRGRLSVAARIGSTDQPRYGWTPAQRALFGNHVDEQSAAINAYLRGQRVKVQVDYTHSQAEDTTTGLDAATAPIQHRVRAALQVGF
jgi:Phosphate-selective porin O and P